MKLKILLFSFLILPVWLFAQKKAKPKLLVYGSDISALAAAVQSARSNVPTVWILDQDQIAPELTAKPLKITNNQHLDGGIWMNILMEMANSKTKNDSIAQSIKNDFSPILARNAIEKIINELPSLTIVKGQQITKISKGKREWQVQLSNKLQYSVLSIVDASSDASLYGQASAEANPEPTTSFQKAAALSLAQSRTVVGTAELSDGVYAFMLKDLLSYEKDNIFDLGLLRKLGNEPESLAFRAAYGQALGATAGYLAFFKSNSKQIDIRKLQAELIAFSARLMPYQDISITDPHYGSIQKSYLTGIFNGRVENEKFLFKKDEAVHFNDVREILNDIYTRSQVWFLDNYRDADLTWKDLFSLIKFVSFRGDEVQQQVEKDWKSKRKFEGELNLDQQVTRVQFAVMSDLYSSSFAKAINLDGSFVK